jgi:hypothetical protein
MLYIGYDKANAVLVVERKVNKTDDIYHIFTRQVQASS